MSPRTLLTGSAAVLAGLGVGLLFFPHDVGSLLGFAVPVDLPLQLFAGGLLAMASLNWMGRGAVYGGIYGRPIVVANFGFGVITTGTLTSALLGGSLGQESWILATVSAFYALGFWRLMSRPPWAEDPPVSSDGDGVGSA